MNSRLVVPTMALALAAIAALGRFIPTWQAAWRRLEAAARTAGRSECCILWWWAPLYQSID